MTFMNPNGSFENDAYGGPVSVFTPLTATTITLKNSDRAVYVVPAGTIAALTVKLPAFREAVGAVVEILFSAIVTALTVQNAAGVTVATAPTAATAGGSMAFRYVDKTIGWVRWR